MFPEPEYAQNIIVGVMFRHTFAWYVTEKEDWYLDYPKYERAWLTAGFPPLSGGDYADRVHIAILNEETAERFLSSRADRRVPASTLSRMMLARKEVDKQDDLLDFSPSLFVNFDQKQLFSQYPEQHPAPLRPDLAWARVTLSLYQYLLQQADRAQWVFLYDRMMEFKAYCIIHFGEKDGDQLLDIHQILDWFVQSLPFSLQEARRYLAAFPHVGWTEMRQLKDIHNRLWMLHALSVAGRFSPEGEVKEWLALRDKLP